MKSIQSTGYAIAIILILLGQHPTVAQYSLENFDINDPNGWYDQQIGRDHSGILQGEYQEIKYISKTTHQFFHLSSWQANTISFTGQVYDSIYLFYDIYKDQLIIQHPSELIYFGLGIKPIQQNVDWFTLDGHFFRNYSTPISNLGKGFFDELFIGETVNLLAKRSKMIKTDNDIQFTNIDKLVIGIDGNYKRFNRKSSLWKIFPEYKKQIKGYIRSNNLSISKDNESELIMLTRYCDGLLSENETSE
ncbi:MAG: hypothetical protein JXR10_17165 [Cyclobacteriaceae bacterium]